MHENEKKGFDLISLKLGQAAENRSHGFLIFKYLHSGLEDV